MLQTPCRRIRAVYFRALIAIVCVSALCIPLCGAHYDFEGLPLTIVATGETTGDVLTYGTYGLQDPPVPLEFDLPLEILWARTYVGVWGGTPRYTGWVSLSVNDGPIEKTNLFGQDDKNENVSASGYGVYWVSYDTTDRLRTGHNTLVATTSKLDPNNKLDGRIYGVLTVVVVRDPTGGSTRYWIADGNENLHGEGWSGANPTIHNEATLAVPVRDISGESANFTALSLTSTRGQPDYILFNGKDLGNPATDSTLYPAGAYDIADETSFNNGIAIDPTQSRYIDVEVFDVKSLLRPGNNQIVFQRGRDLNGDSVITESGEKPEGEDYLHPVFAMLTIKDPSPRTSGPDLAVEQVKVTNAYEGTTGTITADLWNVGTPDSSPATMLFRVDGSEVGRQSVVLDRSGIQSVSTPWNASTGRHAVQAEVQLATDTDIANNVATHEAEVGAPPDLAVTIEEPRVPGTNQPEQTRSPLSTATVLVGVLLGLGSCGILYRRKGTAPVISLLISLLVITSAIPLVSPVSAAESPPSPVVLPVTVKNVGGNNATAFSVTIYLDGEKIATRAIGDGLAAGEGVLSDIPIQTTRGSHRVRVVADEERKVMDRNRANNMVEGTYAFP
jgi:subtilase family serine protease